MKRCGACGQELALTAFARHPQNRDGLQGTCRSCQAAAVPVRRHGMTREEVTALAVEQGGCLGCLTLTPGTKGWVVDHDHSCCGPTRSCARCRRGVLCPTCNTALGMVKDQPDVLRRLADYLERCAPTRDSHAGDRGTTPADSSASQLLPAAPYVRTDVLTKKGLQVGGNLSVRTARVARGQIR